MKAHIPFLWPAYILLATAGMTQVQAVSADIVISQVYGGGGNSGATLKNDFIELFNRGGAPVSVSGWTVQYAAATGLSWVSTALSGTIQPGRYYLVRQHEGNGGSVNLPTPDAFGSINLNAQSGKVALVRSTTLLTGSCPTSSAIADFIGYGAANCAEGNPTSTLSNTTAALRSGGGCTDTDRNSLDFFATSPNPRNSASPLNSCGSTSQPTALLGVGAAAPSTVAAGTSCRLTVTVTPATQPNSTGITVRANLTSIGGAGAQSFFDNGTNGDLAAGDHVFTFFATVGTTISPGVKVLPAEITDAQGRSANASISLTVTENLAQQFGKELIFPHIADGGGWRTTLLLTNGADVPDTVTVQFTASDGFPLNVTIGAQTNSQFSVLIPARGSVKLVTAGTALEGRAGWARVVSSGANRVGGNAVYQLIMGERLVAEASVPPASRISSADFFVDETGGFSTGFAMVNSGSTTATGMLTLRNTSGNVIGTFFFSILPNHHLARMFKEVIPGWTTGRAEITLSSGRISVISLRVHEVGIFSSVSVGRSSASDLRAMFSPLGGIRSEIVSVINQAKSTIDVAIYSFTSDEIRDALIAARNRGVSIRIVADASQVNVSGGEIPLLQQLGFHVKVRSGISGGLMHNKYVIVDRSLLVTGSYNWSAAAEERNFENIVVIEEAETVQDFMGEFEKLWGLSWLPLLEEAEPRAA